MILVIHARPEETPSHGMRISSRNDHVVKMIVNMDGIAQPTTCLRNAPMIAKRLGELQRGPQFRPKKLVASGNYHGSVGPVENDPLAEFDES